MRFFGRRVYLQIIVVFISRQISLVLGNLSTKFMALQSLSDFHGATIETRALGEGKLTEYSVRIEKFKVLLNQDPFHVWSHKSKWNKLSDLRLNNNLMSRAIQLGDPIRFRNVLVKALKGEQINLIVIGGSNSAGGKLGEDEGNLDGIFFKVFSDWWNNTFGKVTKAFIKEFKVAIGGTGSYFYAYCYKTFIPRHTKLDIVLIEASINYNTRSKAESLEQLTRQVLQEPSAPAVLYINLVSGVGPDPTTGKIFNPSCTNLENFGQTELARHYKITSFSLKEVLCRRENGGSWKAVVTNFAGSDGRHIGIEAHAQIAMMMIEYVRGVYNDMFNDAGVDSFINKYTPSKLELPNLFFTKRETEALKKPLCWTGLTPNSFLDLSYPSLQIDVIQKKGFASKSIMQLSNNSENVASSSLRTDAQGGWGAWNRDSILKIGFYVPPIKSQSPNSRSVTIVTRTSGSGGKAMVWLDSNEDKAIYIDSKSVFGNNKLNTVASRVVPGYHTITVKTVRWGMSLVSGVLVGPPDFQRRQVL